MANQHTKKAPRAPTSPAAKLGQFPQKGVKIAPVKKRSRPASKNGNPAADLQAAIQRVLGGTANIRLVRVFEGELDAQAMHGGTESVTMKPFVEPRDTKMADVAVEREIPAQMTNLYNATGDLEEYLAALENRLLQVLRPANEAAAGDKTSDGPNTSIGSQLAGVTDRLIGARYRIGNLLSRLEL